jgi:hypothetical protein
MASAKHSAQRSEIVDLASSLSHAGSPKMCVKHRECRRVLGQERVPYTCISLKAILKEAIDRKFVRRNPALRLTPPNRLRCPEDHAELGAAVAETPRHQHTCARGERTGYKGELCDFDKIRKSLQACTLPKTY